MKTYLIVVKSSNDQDVEIVYSCNNKRELFQYIKEVHVVGWRQI